MNILEVKSIANTYQAVNGEITALKDISFSVKKGEFITIVGPSGCGKSTLLSIISGLLKPTAGSVILEGAEVKGITEKVAYMLQRDNLLDWRSIYKNVMLGLEIQKNLKEPYISRTEALLKTYGLYEFKDKYPTQLSGGMRQRASLIRTLATNPSILLLDEAFSALDYQTRLSVTEDVHHIIKSEGVTTVMVTHDIPESISMSDKIIILSKRPAVVQQILEIDFGADCTSPLCRRNSPKFSEYFEIIWKALDEHEEA